MKMSSKFTCRFCKEQFDQPKGLYKHLQSSHNAGSSADNRTCPICGVLCAKYEGYRDHLLYIHGQSNEGQKLTFKSLNEFLLWKTELEMKYRCKYVLQSAPKVLSSKEKKYFYQCDASVSRSKEKKNHSVVMKQCPSVISVVEGTGMFKVEYWDNHTGHAPVPQMSVENELEAAISSVEMVNAIDESEDSLDKPDEIVVSSSQSPSGITKKPAEKTIFYKNKPVSEIAGSPNAQSTPKTRTIEITPKSNPAKKKSSNMLFNLASVACGKGIVKKYGTEKSEADKSKGPSNVAGKNGVVTLSTTSIGATYTTAKSKMTSDVQVSKVAVTKASPKPKGASSEPQAIAPKIASVQGSSVSSLFGPNQVLFVNSDTNVPNSGQGIVFQLPAGSSIIPASPAATSQSIISKPVATSAGSGKTGKSVLNTSSNAKTVNTTGKSTGLTNGTGVRKSSAPPVVLSSSTRNTSTLINSLPVGSTFMSVNNNLIPIASPSGAFIPTNLPPNIVLTPVVSTAATSQPAGAPTSVSSQIVQNQFSFPTRLNSSARNDPKYSPRTVRDFLTQIAQSPKSAKKAKKDIKPVSNVIGQAPPSKSSGIVPILSKIAASGELSITAKPLPTTPPGSTRAKKRSAQGPSLAHSFVKSNVAPPGRPPIAKSNAVPSRKQPATQTYSPVKSKRPLSVIPKIPNIGNANIGTGTLLFESSGDVFMLEPIDNSAVQNLTLPKSTFFAQKPKVDRSVQTFENLSSAVPRLKRKRTADDEDDSVMMKVKCYQLEMKYLNAKTECKQLKLELTKEKLKNAELNGEKVEHDGKEETEETSRNTASEIMKEIEDKFCVNKQTHIYTLTKTSVLQDLYEDLEELCNENNELLKELESYRAHDKFYNSLKKKLLDEDFET